MSKPQEVPGGYNVLRCRGGGTYEQCKSFRNRHNCSRCWNLGNVGANYHSASYNNPVPPFDTTDISEIDQIRILLDELLYENALLRQRIERLERGG
jgi:hypothetical protein